MSRRDHSNKTRDVAAQLARDGWTVARKGTGDHVQYRHPTKPGRVTLDSGAREVPHGTLVPRTSSSHHNCRESDYELRVQSGTRPAFSWFESYQATSASL